MTTKPKPITTGDVWTMLLDANAKYGQFSRDNLNNWYKERLGTGMDGRPWIPGNIIDPLTSYYIKVRNNTWDAEKTTKEHFADLLWSDKKINGFETFELYTMQAVDPPTHDWQTNEPIHGRPTALSQSEKKNFENFFKSLKSEMTMKDRKVFMDRIRGKEPPIWKSEAEIEEDAKKKLEVEAWERKNAEMDVAIARTKAILEKLKNGETLTPEELQEALNLVADNDAKVGVVGPEGGKKRRRKTKRKSKRKRKRKSKRKSKRKTKRRRKRKSKRRR